jgi:hypothetical protein
VAGACADACVDSRDCPVGAVCNLGTCSLPAPECIESKDCATGKGCSPTGACAKACVANGDCAGGTETCSNGVCVPSGPTTATISGKSELKGLLDHAGIEVRLRGPGAAQVVTGATGAYSFAGLPPGRYSLSLAAASTREERLEAEVSAKAGAVTTAPATVFTPTGEVSGKVTLKGTSVVHGINVFAVGSGLGATTDTSGAYTIRGLPAGTYEVVATFPGYLAGKAAGVVVKYKSPTTVSAMVLDPAPTSSGTTFAFSSTPPKNAFWGRTYTYSPLAGGGGVTAVTYELVSGPTGMTADATGTIVYKPSLYDGQYTVAISANGGGAIIYQVFALSVSGPSTVLASGAAHELDTSGGVTWGTHVGAVSRHAATTTRFTDLGVISGTAKAVSVVNGAVVTGFRYPGGKLTGAKGPFGTLSATWPGGTATSWSVADRLVVASVKVEGGTVGSAGSGDTDVVAAISYPTGIAASFSYSKLTPTAFSAATGVASAVTSTELTDSSAAFPIGAGSDLKANPYTTCVANRASGAYKIASNTATSITLLSPASGYSTDFKTAFVAGRRYFLVACSTKETTYTITDPSMPATIAAGRQVDLYLPGQHIGYFTIMKVDTASPSKAFTIRGPMSVWSSLAQATGKAFYVPETPSPNGLNAVEVQMSDPQTDFTKLGLDPLLYRVGFDGNAASFYPITAYSATTLTLSAPMGSLVSFGKGLKWRLVTRTTPYTVGRFTFKTGFATSPVGKALLFDESATFANATSTTTDPLGNTVVTALIPASVFPIGRWQGTLAGVVDSTNTCSPASFPLFTVTDAAGTVPPLSLGRTLVRIDSSGSFTDEGIIVAGTGSSFSVQASCPYYYSCCTSANRIRDTFARLRNSRYAVGIPSPLAVRMRVALTGASLSPDSLVGKTVGIEGQPGKVGTIVANEAAALVVEVKQDSFAGFEALAAGSALSVAQAAGSFRVTLTDANAAFTKDQWVDYRVVAGNGEVGKVVGNTDKTIDLVVADLADLPSPGEGYAFIQPTAGGTGGPCVGAGITVTAKLAGAVLTPGAYARLEALLDPAQYTPSSLGIVTNSANDATLAVCPSQFKTLLQMLGKTAALTTGGSPGNLQVELQDSASAYPAGSLVGKKLFLLRGSPLLTPAISANDAKAITLTVDSRTWLTRLMSAAVAGVPYAVAEGAHNEITVTVTTTGSFTKGTLENRFVRLHSRRASDVQRMLVRSHDATQLTALAGVGMLDDLAGVGQAALDRLTSSAGAVLKLTDSAATFTPDALVGRGVDVVAGSPPYRLEIVSNTATEIVAVTTDTSVVSALRTPPYAYRVRGLEPTGAVLALPTGEAYVASSNGRAEVWKLGASGVVKIDTRLGTSTALSVKPVPVTVRGTVASYQDVGNTSVVSDPSWSFAPGEHAGAVFVYRRNYNNWYSLPILSNTSTSFTIGGTLGCCGGPEFLIDPVAVDVVGGGLTPGALAGKRLFSKGFELQVRGNTASRIRYFPNSKVGDESPTAVEPAGATSQVLDTLDGRTVSGLASDGAGGYFASTADAGLIRQGGSLKEQYGERESSSTTGKAGKITAYAGGSLTDASASFLPGELIGLRLSTDLGLHTILDNTATTIRIASPGPLWVLLPGDSYSILKADGFSRTNDVAASGGAVWVATSTGVFKLASGSFARYTRAGTESSLGAADGIPGVDVTSVGARGASEVWVACAGFGAAKFDGTKWTRFTVASTESAFGAGDGLPSNFVHDFFFTASATWFATSLGAARLDAATFTQFGAAVGVPAVLDVTVSPAGDPWFATFQGVVKYVP